MPIDTAPREVPRTLMSVLTITALLGSAIYVLSPFLPALVWATTLTITTWPVLTGLQARFGGRRWPAVVVMVTILLAVLLVPLYLAISTLASSADKLGDLAAALEGFTLPPPPDWVASVPMVGPKLAETWQQKSAVSHVELVAELKPYAARAVQVLASQAGSFGATVVQFLLTVIIAAILYGSGEAAALSTRRFFRRFAGERGDWAVVLAGKAVRAVALGVVVTAVAQTTLTGIGLVIAGVPRAGLLTALALVLCIAQIGPMLVLLPAVIWTFASGRTAMGVFFLVWALGTVMVDNVLRPYLIKKGADLPLWLIFSGVIGGLLAFGVIGLFIGPVVLAVAYTLLGSWTADLGPEPAEPTP